VCCSLPLGAKDMSEFREVGLLASGYRTDIILAGCEDWERSSCDASLPFPPRTAAVDPHN